MIRRNTYVQSITRPNYVGRVESVGPTFSVVTFTGIGTRSWRTSDLATTLRLAARSR